MLSHLPIWMIFFSLAFILALANANPTQSMPNPAKSTSKHGIFRSPIRKLVKSSLLNKEGLKQWEVIEANMNSIRNNGNHNAVEELMELNGEFTKQSIDFHDQMYVADITLGIPPQEFTVLLRTGTYTFWVVDKSCDASQKCNILCEYTASGQFCYSMCDEYCCEDNPIDKTCSCENKRKFDSTKSKTYRKDGHEFTLCYRGANCVNCFQGNDTLRFGEISEFWALSIPDVIFGQATSIGRNFRDFPFDGILGLGYKIYRSIESPIFTAIRKGLLAEPMFTVFLESAGNHDHQQGGLVTFGGIDTKNCGPIQGWTPLVPQMSYLVNYRFEIEGVSYGKKYRTTKRQRAFSNLETSLIVGDGSIIRNLAKNAGATYNDLFSLYLIDCEAEYEPITFTISGKEYSLPKEVLTIDMFGTEEQSKMANITQKKKTCVFGLKPVDFLPQDQENYSWILGDPFMRHFCNIHDIGNMRMGFARSIQRKQKEQSN